MQAMIRELNEELGIPLEEAINISSVGNLDLKFNNKGTSKRNFFIEFYCLMRKNENVKIQKEEIESISYMPMEEVFELIKNGKTKFPKDDRYEEIFDKVKKKSFFKQIEEEKEI